MNEEFDLLIDRCYRLETDTNDTDEIPMDDDRYPGSFFRIPTPPSSAQTGWCLR
ncbi:MAG: hypothetical protein K9L60_03295 [Methylovulum sp.]|jgi:hypothetical protein|nr:hypothetical protein [Methylovulum sp.]MCF7997818.1 hypothetical protein [Methylovulum sp.]